MSPGILGVLVVVALLAAFYGCMVAEERRDRVKVQDRESWGSE